ncbi:MAG TPA: NUDIX hydrolase [Candidatus Hydrogenedentes bacterium]|nr:NUDIX hydrolase [Candidatus Hydrogenedentota bacterium]HQM50718.1 NUDIX hydrolase [Candidatus Hydrogenedentota bacterium]
MTENGGLPPVPRIRAAAILRKGDSVLLVQHQKEGQTYWLLPGGGVNFGESLAEALQREVREETGLDISVGDIALVNDSLSPDKRCHIVNICFWGEVRGGILTKGSDPRLCQARFVPIRDISGFSMLPDLRGPLSRLLSSPGISGPTYLGNLWRDLP